ncbi:hypothetical protein MMPV_001230 [Pyropia vietnamensis]
MYVAVVRLRRAAGRPSPGADHDGDGDGDSRHSGGGAATVNSPSLPPRPPLPAATWSTLPADVLPAIAAHLSIPDLHAARLAGADAGPASGGWWPLAAAARQRIAALAPVRLPWLIAAGGAGRGAAAAARAALSPVGWCELRAVALPAGVPAALVAELAACVRLTVVWEEADGQGAAGTLGDCLVAGAPAAVSPTAANAAGGAAAAAAAAAAAVAAAEAAAATAASCPTPDVPPPAWWRRLESLTLTAYPATTLPGWVVGLPRLTSLTITAAPALTTLGAPPVRPPPCPASPRRRGGRPSLASATTAPELYGGMPPLALRELRLDSVDALVTLPSAVLAALERAAASRAWRRSPPPLTAPPRGALWAAVGSRWREYPALGRCAAIVRGPGMPPLAGRPP